MFLLDEILFNFRLELLRRSFVDLSFDIFPGYSRALEAPLLFDLDLELDKSLISIIYVSFENIRLYIYIMF